MKTNENCLGCVYWNQNARQLGVGECRRHSPTFIDTDKGPQVAFPLTTQVAWCGDFAPNGSIRLQPLAPG